MTSTSGGFRSSAARTLLRVTGLSLCIAAISPPAIAQADAVPGPSISGRTWCRSPSFVISVVARQIAAAEGSSLSENARSLALLMMAINDSLIASFYNKYHYDFWRPVTAIHAGAADGNRKTEGDTTFRPFIPTPCFPGYPSNHASGTNGGLEMLRRLFGAAGHEITITATVPPLTTVTPALPGMTLTRHYTQLKEIADDVDDARVYGGIHFRFDQRAGNTLGRAVATYVFKNTLRPMNGEE